MYTVCTLDIYDTNITIHVYVSYLYIYCTIVHCNMLLHGDEPGYVDTQLELYRTYTADTSNPIGAQWEHDHSYVKEAITGHIRTLTRMVNGEAFDYRNVNIGY